MRVRKLFEPREKKQCTLHKNRLYDIGWKGYREGRAAQNGKDPNKCMRIASWTIDGRPFCTQHAGIYVLNELVEQGD